MTTLDVPLRFHRLEIEKPWGGRALERCPGLALASPGPVGETWEIVDRPGEEVRVAGGPFEGRTLGELVREHRAELLGKASPTPHGRFPLLVKYLDARENLSVQVHPDEEGAIRIGDAEPKTEAWYFLAVEPDARIYAGLRPETTPGAFERAAASRAVLAHLETWQVAAGQCLLVPGGTVHAIGAGVTLLEVQQNSDTTYRLWDWDRVGADGRARETHLAQALEATHYDLPRRAPVDPVWETPAAGLRRAPMARTRTFAMNALAVEARVRLSTGNQFQIYAVESGAGTLAVRGGEEAPIAGGDVLLVPAAAGYHYLAPRSSDAPLRLVQLLTKA
jgi:mannose-6-phosphate isomerase